MLAGKIAYFRPTGFDPRSISGLALWLDAADQSTIFQNSDGTLPAVAANDPVGYWADKSANGLHFSQATTANRPLVSQALFSRRAIRFDGVNDVLSRAGISNTALASAGGGTGGSVFAVVRPISDTAYSFFHNAGGSSHRDLGGGFHTPLYFRGTRIEGTLGGGVMPSNAAFVYSNHSIPATNTQEVRLNGATRHLATVGTNWGFWSGVGGGSVTYLVGNGPNNDFLNGEIAEIIQYTTRLTTAQVNAVERYLSDKWGIPLLTVPTASNADAQSWINRVYANGGEVSTSTASAVNTFCNSIDSAGLRDRFYRLNLFCGTGLSSCLVPLYRGQSLGGTQFGNATDTNGNFVSGDYAENAGLVSNSAKYLATGCSLSGLGLGVSLHHHQTYFGPITLNNRFSFGTTNSGACRLISYAFSEASQNWMMTYSGSTATETYPTGSFFRRLVFSRTATNLATVYADGVAAGSNSTSTSPVADTNDIWVFRSSSAGAGGQSLGVGMRSYSFGLSMTATQAASFDSALAAFFTAIGRPT